MPEKRTTEQRINRLEWYALIGFILSAVIFGLLIFVLYDNYTREVEWESTITHYQESLALADSANRLVLENAQRWKHEQDSLAALKVKQ